METKPILVAVDFTESSDLAVEQARSLASKLGTGLSFAHVVALPPASPAEIMGPLGNDLGAFELARHELQGLVKESIRQGIAAEHHLCVGSVVMGFHVSHPANFASYSFTVYKGVNVRFSGGGPVAGAPSSLTDTTAHLLGTCKIAGYAEYLYVAASMIDVEVRQSQYDASAALAFVLAPQ